jgi:uncharacterized SAM-binding protein YcdF (DUF218 family)
MTPEALALARIVFDYQILGHQPLAADVMVVCGTNDIRVAHHAVDLYQKGLAPLIVCTGGIAHTDDILATGWHESEAEVYGRTMCERGIPEDRILLEPRSKNTGENIRFTRRLLAERGISPANALVVVKPFMQRRTAATWAVEWPELPFSVSSWRSTFDEYCTPDLTPEKVTHTMMGDLQRLWIYAAKGWQATQRIPPTVCQAFQELRDMGYVSRLLPEVKP